jgi:hypothetical protein
MSNSNYDLQRAEKAVTTAEQVITNLQTKRAAALARAEEITASRRQIGFRVHAGGDKDARAQLDKLNLEDATLAGEVQSLDGALVEADNRCRRLSKRKNARLRWRCAVS